MKTHHSVYHTTNPGEVKLALGCWGCGVLINLALIAAGAAVVVHFLMKWW